MKKRTISRSEKRRIHVMNQKFQAQLAQAEGNAYQRGLAQGVKDGFARGTSSVKEAEGRAHANGVKQGSAENRVAVLDHAGRLYKERKDSDAAAVREVHSLLVEAAKQS